MRRRPFRNRRRSVAGALLAALAATGGCKALFTPLIIWGQERTKLVQAEWPYLQDKKVCLLVWAEMDTLFEYPNVSYEVAERVRTATEPNVAGLSFIPNRQVAEFQRKNPDWERSHPAVIGARFGAERVLLIELTQYTTRESDSPHLYRGRISANLRIYDAGAPDAGPVWSRVVETVYPRESFGQWGSNDQTIRLAAMESFAHDVAGKFYDRKVKVEK